jgi:predicted nucleic acid-binding protein
VRVLVDTSVWSLALRRRPGDLGKGERPIVSGLTELIKDGRAAIIGMIRQELLSGIRTSAQFEQLRRTLAAFRDEPVGTEDHEAAARAANACRAQGIAVSAADMLICSVAHRRDMPVFTTDPDFSNYARALMLKLYAVAGT